MTGAIPRVRYIKPETIVLGDVIRVTSGHDGVETTRTGRVESRDYEGAATVYRTAEGGEVLRYIRENGRRVRVTLVEPSARRSAVQEPLFNMEAFA